MQLLSSQFVALAVLCGAAATTETTNAECDALGLWDGEFFPGIPQIQARERQPQAANQVGSALLGGTTGAVGGRGAGGAHSRRLSLLCSASLALAQYEGPESVTPLAFHRCNSTEVVLGRPMKEWRAAYLAAATVYPAAAAGSRSRPPMEPADWADGARPRRLRFSLAFWHAMRSDGSDAFGAPSRRWPWEQQGAGELELAGRRRRAFF
jgi:hypothetical protein